VLRETHCPAALIEAGFLSNSDEAQRMKSGKWQAECAERIAKGILDYSLKVISLNKAVAAKRKLEAESNERWQHYLANKKEEALKEQRLAQSVRNEPILMAATSSQAIQTEISAAQQSTRPAEMDIMGNTEAKASESMAIDLEEITQNSVQSVATNIYLKNDESESDETASTTTLKTLAEFHETGKVE
jgi:hypothetical protein